MLNFEAEHRAGLLGGETVLQGQAIINGQPSITLTPVPYYAWQNRGKHGMIVWILDRTNP